MRTTVAAMLLLIAACRPARSYVDGYVQRARELAPADTDEDTAAGFDPFVGARVRIVARDPRGSENKWGFFSRADVDRQGHFRATAPVGQRIYAEIGHPDEIPVVTATFTGVTGPENDVLDVSIDAYGDAPLFGVPAAQVEELRARFAGCPGADGPGAIVFGEVRVFGLVDPETGREPIVTTARARVCHPEVPDCRDLTHDGERVFEACYLTDDGGAYDPEREVTGDTGWFAVFGVPPHDVGDPGQTWLLDVTFAARPAEDGQEQLEDCCLYDIWVPPPESADAIVAVPRLPAWVEFPF